MTSFAIQVRGLSKRYALGELKLRETLGETLLARWPRKRAVDRVMPGRHAPREVWALDDVSFELAPGEILGVVGRNGAGKSTLLKILSRITEPTRGRAEIRGRVGSLLEVGTGFHPDLTGRENVFMNGAILGMTQREVRAKFDQIVDFADIGAFIDTPVKRYSSGMFTRLAFAVAAHLEPDILIVDEVLAVGDVSFQKKCLGRMGDMTRAGRTVLFVSHNMASISSLCSRCLFMNDGRIDYDGRPDLAIQRYTDSVMSRKSGETHLHRSSPDVPVYVTYLALRNASGELAAKLEMGEVAVLEVEYVLDRPLLSVTMAMLLSRNGVPLIYSYDTDLDVSLRERREPGTYSVRIELPCDHLKEGNYSVDLKIGWDRVEVTDPQATLEFEVVNYRHDLTHKGYRSDRPGEFAYDLRWETTRCCSPRARPATLVDGVSVRAADNN